MNERFLCKGSVTVWVKPFSFWKVKFGEWCTGSVRGSFLTLPYSLGHRAILETQAAVNVQWNLRALIEWVHMTQTQHQISPLSTQTHPDRLRTLISATWETGRQTDKQAHIHTHTHTHTLQIDLTLATPSSILAWRIPMDRGAWRSTVHGVAKSQTWLSD